MACSFAWKKRLNQTAVAAAEQYNYDVVGRTASVTAPDGSVTSYVYQGNTLTVTDAAEESGRRIGSKNRVSLIGVLFANDSLTALLYVRHTGAVDAGGDGGQPVGPELHAGRIWQPDGADGDQGIGSGDESGGERDDEPDYEFRVQLQRQRDDGGDAELAGDV